MYIYGSVLPGIQKYSYIYVITVESVEESYCIL